MGTVRALDQFNIPYPSSYWSTATLTLSRHHSLIADTPLPHSRSIGYSSECLGLHVGWLHIANLGDGAGNRTEELLARINFDWPSKVLLLCSLLSLRSLLALFPSPIAPLSQTQRPRTRFVTTLGFRRTRCYNSPGVTGVARLGHLLGDDCGWESLPRLEAGRPIRSNGGVVPGVRIFFPPKSSC